MTGSRNVQQLLDVVADTLDPGYAAAAKRGRRPHWYDKPLVAVGALLVGFLLVLAYVHTNRGAPQAQRVHERLVERVHGAQDAADALAQNVQSVEAELDRARAAALPSAGADSRLDTARVDAGQVAVRGPGLVVTLAEPAPKSDDTADERGGSVPISTTHILTDRDVRAVVNELWRDGAEAIAVNRIRLTPTSAVRFAGEAVLVDFQPLTSPYRIEAIGDADRLATEFAQSEVASKYQTLRGASGIGFSFRNEDDLDLPTGTSFTPKFASPAPTPTSAPTATKSSR